MQALSSGWYFMEKLVGIRLQSHFGNISKLTLSVSGSQSVTDKRTHLEGKIINW